MNNVLSLVTSFKKFKGIYDTIQKSVLYSYRANNMRVIIPNNEIFTVDKCGGYDNITILEGIKHARDLGFNIQASVIKDLMLQALPRISSPMVGFIKSDVLLTDGFYEKCCEMFERRGLDAIYAGSRENISLTYYITDEASYMKAQQEPRVASSNLDFFITSKYIWRKILADMPEFIMGRYYYENWLLGEAEKVCSKHFDCSNMKLTSHCAHDYNHIRLFERADGESAPSSIYNRNLWLETGRLTTDLKSWPEA